MANTITNKKNSVLCEVNGVTYFKLISNYQGDRTKNCSLLSNEIDANFYFLRGIDIKKVNFNNDTRELVLTRLNGDQLKTIIPEKENFTLDYDKENGVLTVNFADGTTESVDGFLVEKDLENAIKKILGKSVKVATDSTINGDGRVINPLRLSEVERTGTYAPAKYLIDLTEDDNVMPETDKEGNNFAKGARIVTKELFTKFGRLYTRRDVENIERALAHDNSSSMWRIPTKCDWDGLLVAAECEDYANYGTVDPDCDWDSFVNPGICPKPNIKHCTTEINVWTGKDAGARAKSITSWTDSDREEDGNSVKGEDNIPSDAGSSTQTFHVIPIGYGEGSRGVISKDEDSDIEGIGQVASFWTNTPVVSGINGCYAKPNYYTRTFAFDTRKVLQESSKPESRLSLRLVRDYDYENMQYKEYETILGRAVPCVLVTDERTDYAQVWTSININFNEFSGVTSDAWSALTSENVTGVYFINEWDGEKWIKKQMNEGDSVVLLDGGEDESGNTIYNHEWRVYKEENEDGSIEYELIDTLDALKDEMGDVIDALNDRIDDLEDRLNQEIQDREDGDNELWDALSAETADRIEADEELQDNIDTVESALTQEIADREAADEELWDALSAETQARMDADEELQDNIDAEEYRATERENAIENALFEEIDRATAAEEALNEKIDEVDGGTVISGEFVSDDSNAVNKLVLTKKNDEKVTIDFNANFGELPE